MDLPVFKLVIDESDSTDSGVDFIALVDEPAIERDFMAFNKKNRERFKMKSEDKRLISGFAMVADMPIYRRDEDGKEYYVVFDADTIKKIVYKFFRNDYAKNVNIMHDKNNVADGVYVVESFLLDSERGIKTPEGFESAPDGSWFVTMRVDNDEIWNEFIKTGQFKGFSVEGMFEPVESEQLENEFNLVCEILKNL